MGMGTPNTEFDPFFYLLFMVTNVKTVAVSTCFKSTEVELTTDVNRVLSDPMIDQYKATILFIRL